MSLFNSRKHNLKLSLLLFLIFSLNICIGQTAISKNNFQFEQFKLPGGVLSNQVRQIVQDDNGFLWFATRNGLIKYDNRSFKIFQKDLEKENTLPTNILFSLLLDSKGMLWVGTYGSGVTRFDTNLEEFIPIPVINDSLKTYGKIYVFSLLEDKQQNIWIGTDKGLFKYNSISNNITRYQADKKKKTALSTSIIWSLYMDKQETIWIGTGIPWLKDTTVGGLHKYNRETNDFTKYIHEIDNPNSIADNRVNAIFEDSKDNFWVGTMGAGLHLMDRSTGNFTRYGDLSNPTNSISRPYIEDPSYADKNFSQVTFIHEDQMERLWIGAFNGGLNIYNPLSKQQLHFETEKGNTPSKGIQSNYLLNLLETKDQSIFICTGDVGDLYTDFVIKANYSSNLFTTISLPIDQSSKGLINCIVEDKLGNLLLGTKFQSGLFKWNSKQQLLENKASHFKSNPINNFTISQEGNLWVGYKTEGIEVLNSLNLKKEPIDFPENFIDELSKEHIQCIFEDSKGNTWISKKSTGITILQSNRSIFHLDTGNGQDNDLSAETIDYIIEDKKGFIWLFGNTKNSDGIYSMSIDKYDMEANKTTTILPLGRKNGFTLSVDIDEQNNLWFTYGLDGIKKLNTKTGVIETFNTSNSLIPTDEIIALIVTKDGNIWMSASDHIIYHNPSSLSFRKYDQLDGVSIKLSPSSIYERSNGHLIFGGENAFLNLDPTLLETQFDTTEIIFTDLKINNKSIATTTDFLSNTPIWETKQITLAHDENNFSIGISCLDYHSKYNPLEYYLENHDSYWRKLSTDKQAIYINIPTGNYILRTRGANSSGQWLNEGPSLSINIRAPWWKAWWAYVSYFLLGSGIIYSLYKFQLKLQAEKQEAEKIKEIDELKTKLYANITHEFRTPLTIILGNATQLKQESSIQKLFRDKAKNIEKSGQQLLRLVNQLLDLRKLEANKEVLNLVQGDIVPVLMNFTDSFESLAISKGIGYQINLPNPPLVMDYDYDKLQKVVSNLISNAIKFTAKGDKVAIFAQQIDNQLLINIKDEGLGISADQLPHIFDRFYRADNTHQTSGTGIGLALTKELVDLLQGTIIVNSQPSVGSDFTVKIPITNQAVASEHKTLTPLSVEEFTTQPPIAIDAMEKGQDLPIVLIVEDNRAVAEFTASCLKEDYNIHVAADGQAGVEQAYTLIPDLIISDVMMPFKDGFQLCQELKNEEKTSHIPIILLTAKADIADKLAGLERGADAYLAKPFNEQELKIRIKQLIQLREKLKIRYAGLSLQQPSTDKALQLDDEFILKVRAIIEADLDNTQFGVEDLSKAIFLSRAQVHRKIKALTGKSTGQFMHTIRLHHALAFLQASDQSITSIAFDVGYNDPSYFTRMFTREFGNPPSFYSKKKE